MKLTIQLNNATGVFVGEASSIIEFEAIRSYLIEQGMFGAAPRTEAADPKAETATAGTVKEGTKPSTKGNAKKDKPEPEAKPADAAPAADTAKTAAAPTIEDVVAVMTKVADEFGVPEALILNKRFGCKKAGELKDTQYAEYIAFATKCLNEKRAPSASHETAETEDVSGLV
ncbi:MAG TPA: hypothetical protein VJ840_18605 [Gemmatimonadaceae bacterium]|nr:hypothetical protein [Gemmatimonadaceae bacterium]